MNTYNKAMSLLSNISIYLISYEAFSSCIALKKLSSESCLPAAAVFLLEHEVTSWGSSLEVLDSHARPSTMPKLD